MGIIEKTNKKMMVIAIIIFTLLIPTIVSATTHSTTLFFQYRLVGEKRQYAAGNMRCIVNDAFCPEKTGTQAFTVTCKKSTLGFDPQIGTTKTYYATPGGYDNSRYFGSGVSSGEYYFIFLETPANDIPIRSFDVVFKTE